MKYIAILSLLILMSATMKAQDTELLKRDISLLILDKKGRPVDHVTVKVLKGRSAGVTDEKGVFVFEGLTDKDSISMLLPEYGETLLPVKGLNSVTVTLRSARSYSYLNPKGKNINVNKNSSASTSVLDVPAMLKQRNYRSLTALLQTNVPGLNIYTQTDGTVSSTTRGISTFSQSTEPLVIFDGITLGSLEEANRAVNLNDIQTIEVLKDGAKYGSRGANGVILITSKKM